MSDFELDEITEIFLEESQEGLDTMETGLLGLEKGKADPEIMNDIFRAAHSIKGGAGTFGFMAVSEFTHGVETLLDEMRAEERDVTPDAVQLLLRTVDRLRAMMDEIQQNGQVDASQNEALEKEILSLLDDNSTLHEAPEKNPQKNQKPAVVTGSGEIEIIEVKDVVGSIEEKDSVTRWSIEFAPHKDMLSDGNDPLRIFSELRNLAHLVVTVDASDVPEIMQLNTQNCYFKWQLTLTGNVTEEQINEVFVWIDEDCDFKINEELEWVSPDETKTLHVEAQAVTDVPVAQPIKTIEEVLIDTNNEASLEPPKKAQSQVPKVKVVSKESTSIRVSIEKVDSLLNLVGELVITQSMLKRFGNEVKPEDLKDLGEGLSQLERYTRELQESVMDIRMLPISFAFNRFPRLVHDISRKLGKTVELEVMGEQTEVDKTVLEKIGDPLVHLIRNSLDHGIEESEKRIRAGKPEAGKLTLSATQEGGNIVIRVIDDGAGINKDKLMNKAIEKGIIGPDDSLSEDKIHNLIFHPGFSTVDEVSDLSGRGVGMDVVRRNIKDLGGRVEVLSEEGVGTSFVIRLPLTLAILDGQLVKVGDETYIMSLLSIVETVLLKKDDVNAIAGRADVYQMRGEYIPILWMQEILQDRHDRDEDRDGLLVVVEADGMRVGLFVDELLDQQQVVIKNLDDNYMQVDGVSGATILGDGTVALILDIPGLLHGCLSDEASQAVREKNVA